MLLFLLFSLSVHAKDFGFYAMEDSEIRIGLECLPAEAKIEIKAKEKSPTIQKIFSGGDESRAFLEARYLQLSHEKQITKACGLEGLQAYFDGKLYPLSGTQYFKYVISEKDECGYSVPRVDVTFLQNPFREIFLLGPGFTVLKGNERRKAEKDFKAAKGVDWKFGRVRGYFSRKGETYMVFDETEMGTKLSLFRLKGEKAELTDSAGFEPCGS